MKIFIVAVLSVAIGSITGWVFCIRALKKKRRRVKADAEKKQMETAKRIIWVCLINGFAWVWCSYLLAYLDRAQIAESLSQIAVTEIIASVLAYCIKSTVENLSKNNRWPDKEKSEDSSEPPAAG